MKKIYLTLLSVLFVFTGAFAQEGDQQPPEKKIKEIEALKVAFITKELELTPEEAQKFLPIYNQYSKELKAVMKSTDDDVLEKDEKKLNIRKKYKDQFLKAISAEKVNKLFSIEGKFHQLLIKAMRKQQKMQENQKGPYKPN